MSRNNALLTRSECSVMRAIAILGIVLHNYCHWLGGIVRENEYTWTKGNADFLTRILAHPDMNLPVHLLSFFGHYGVPVFFFLSAYGLFIKYEGNEKRVGVWNFTRYHYLKLFKMMIVGFVAFTIIDLITPGTWHYTVLGVVAQLGMFNNLLAEPHHVIWPGPYWFFGVMLQLYIIYRLFLYRKGWKTIITAIIVCWLAQVFCSPEGSTLNYIRYNFVGGMLPFGAGLLYARYGKTYSNNVNLIIMIASAVLVFVLSYNYQAWFFAPLFVCSFVISSVKLISNIQKSPISSIFFSLNWLGSISAALFICHPLMRKIFIPISRHGDIYTGLLLYTIASIAVAWLFNEVLKRIPSPKLK